MILNVLGGVILLVIFVGVYFKHDRRTHVPIMLSAFAADVAMVLYIELSRGAVEQVGGEENPAILDAHIALSVATMVCWLVQLASGVRLLKTGRGRTFHKISAGVFLLLRSGNFVTSWMV